MSMCGDCYLYTLEGNPDRLCEGSLGRYECMHNLQSELVRQAGGVAEYRAKYERSQEHVRRLENVNLAHYGGGTL